MKKITRKCLDELALTMPTINEIDKKSYVGGGNGTAADPYTMAEFDAIANWQGGYVEGLGYVGSGIICTPSGNYANLGEYVAALASSNVGKDEHNNPEDIINWLGEAGIPSGNVGTPWCATFVNAMYEQAGYDTPDSAAVNDWRDYGSSTTNPKVGDIAIFNGMSHMGIVVAVNGDQVTVVSGNSNAGGNEGIVSSQTMNKSSFTFRTAP